MSHKLVRRSKKIVDEEVTNADFKSPDNTKTKDESTKDLKNDDVSNSGEKKDVPKKSPKKEDTVHVDSVNGEDADGSTKQRVQTRSRSNTPLKKNIESTNGVKVTDECPIQEEEETIEVKDVKIDNKTEGVKESASDSPSNSVEMDPLVLDKDEEEAIPELQFDENDIEVESEGSNSRCKTRRSQSRNVCTPKTPKNADNEELEIVDQFLERAGSTTPKTTASFTESKNNIAYEADLNDSCDTQSSVSTSNISTKVQIDSDVTRNMDLSGQDSGLFEEHSLSNASGKSFSDTLKNLSGRKAIRSAGTPFNRTDYLRHVLKKNSYENKGDIYAEYESVERISVGMKRKSRSFSPNQAKRIKTESSGIFSYFANPFSNIKNSFTRSDSPKLLAMETKSHFDEDQTFHKINIEIADKGETKWCDIM